MISDRIKKKFKIPTKRKEIYCRISEMTEGFYIAIFATGPSRLKVEVYDDR
jgi:hypothetical protein